MTRRALPTGAYKALLVAAAVIWGLSFVVMKDAVSAFQPAYLLGIRFMFAGLILTVVFFRRMRTSLTRDCLVAGCVVGLLHFFAYWSQTVGIVYTTPGKNAFLTATYIAMVPFLYWVVARKRPTVFNIVAAVMCLGGIGLVSLSAGSLTIEYGDLMTLVCAVFFAMHFACVAKYSERFDTLVLTVLQFWVGGVCGLLAGVLTEVPPDFAAITPDFVYNMVYLTVFASCVAMGFQNAALAHVSPAQSSLILSLESVLGVLFSIILYGEQVTLRMVAGFALIFAAIVVSEVLPQMRRGRRKVYHGQHPAKEEVVQ